MIVSPVSTGKQLEFPFYPGHIYAALKPIEADKVRIDDFSNKHLLFWCFRYQLSLCIHQDQRSLSITIMNIRLWISRLARFNDPILIHTFHLTAMSVQPHSVWLSFWAVQCVFFYWSSLVKPIRHCLRVTCHISSRRQGHQGSIWVNQVHYIEI